MSKIKIPENIKSPEAKRNYLLSKGECLTNSPLFDEAKRLKGKTEVAFVIRDEGGGTKMWGVGLHETRERKRAGAKHPGPKG